MKDFKHVPRSVVLTRIYDQTGNVFIEEDRFDIQIEPEDYMAYLRKTDLPELAPSTKDGEYWFYDRGVFVIRQNSEFIHNGKHIPKDGKEYQVSEKKWAKVQNNELVIMIR